MILNLRVSNDSCGVSVDKCLVFLVNMLILYVTIGLEYNRTVKRIPTPLNDIYALMRDEKIRSQLTTTMDQIQQVLDRNARSPSDGASSSGSTANLHAVSTMNSFESPRKQLNRGPRASRLSISITEQDAMFADDLLED